MPRKGEKKKSKLPALEVISLKKKERTLRPVGYVPNFKRVPPEERIAVNLTELNYGKVMHSVERLTEGLQPKILVSGEGKCCINCGKVPELRNMRKFYFWVASKHKCVWKVWFCCDDRDRPVNRDRCTKRGFDRLNQEVTDHRDYDADWTTLMACSRRDCDHHVTREDAQAGIVLCKDCQEPIIEKSPPPVTRPAATAAVSPMKQKGVERDQGTVSEMDDIIIGLKQWEENLNLTLSVDTAPTQKEE